MTTPIISFIVAISDNNVIGNRNALPWHLPDDLRFFKKHTLNKCIIMGRKTFESIGKPLPKRRNIILSREKHSVENTEWVSSLQDALNLCANEKEIMIIGGAQVYQMAHPFIGRLYLTRVHAKIYGDTELPQFDFSNAKQIFEEKHPKDDQHDYPFTFQIWDF